MAIYPKTLAGMRSRILAELVRPDLTDQVTMAISDAIAVYQKERFRFSDIDPAAPPTFNTVAGRYIYDSVDNANIASAFAFDHVYVTIGDTLQAMSLWSADEVRRFNEVNTMAGQPYAYAYEGNKLLLSPIPTGGWPITLSVFRRIAAPETDNEANNPWMVDAERLIRARVKFEIATHITRNPKMAQAMSPDPPDRNGGVVGATWREYRSLKGEGNRVTGSGRIRPMRF